MTLPSLGAGDLEHIRAVRRRHPEVRTAMWLGSRAKATQGDRSDTDIALSGDIDPLRAEAIAAELEDQPPPWRFDVLALAHLRYPDVRAHIHRVGVVLDRRDPGSCPS